MYLLFHLHRYTEVHYCIFSTLITRVYEEMLTQLREEIQSCARHGLLGNLNNEGVSTVDVYNKVH